LKNPFDQLIEIYSHCFGGFGNQTGSGHPARVFTPDQKAVGLPKAGNQPGHNGDNPVPGKAKEPDSAIFGNGWRNFWQDDVMTLPF